nr:tRNA (guanine-N(7)-)-methyltransferase non-catalytic subunit wuho [Onthophagus taurus]
MIILKHLDNEKLLISTSKSLLLYDISKDTSSDIELPQLSVIQKGNHETNIISSIATSKCGNYFALLRNKQVIIYDKKLNVIKEISLKRAAHSIMLFGGYNLLVADKTGDVYLYKSENEGGDKDGILLFGHLSMLLDVVLSDNEKFLITCDRDEKIRVSHYPNTYNIEKFCLGHKEFVTKLVLLENSFLLSASGDGQIILWDYLKGVNLHKIDTSDYVKDKSVLNNFIETMKHNKTDVMCLPIVDIQVQKIENVYYIVVQIYKLKSLLIFSIDAFDNFESRFIDELSFKSEIQTFSLRTHLFVATKEDIKTFCVLDNKYVEVKKVFFENFKISIEGDDNCDIITLFKRKFDNVEEYLERKRQRIETKCN